MTTLVRYNPAGIFLLATNTCCSEMPNYTVFKSVPAFLKKKVLKINHVFTNLSIIVSRLCTSKGEAYNQKQYWPLYFLV